MKLNVLKKISFKNKLLITFLLFYLIPLLIVSIVSYTFLEKSVTQRTITNHQAILDNTKTQIDKSINMLEKYNFQLMQKPWVNSFRYMETDFNKLYDPFDIRKFADELKIFSSANEIANDVSIYFSKSQKLISSLSSNLENLDFFVQNIFSANKMEDLLTSQFESTKCVVLKDAYNYKRKIDGVILAYPMKFENANSDEGVVIFYFISNATITGIMQNNIKNPFLITYENENIATGNANDALFNNVKDKISDDVNFKTPIKFEDKSYCVLSSDGHNDWKFYSILPMSIVSSGFKVFKFSFIIGIIVFSILGFICSYYIAIRNYRPLEKIIQQLNTDKNSSQIKTNEFSWLGSAIEVIMNKEQNLTSQIETQRPLLCNTYLAWILKTKEQKEEADIRKALSYLDVHMDNLWFNVIVCSNDNDINLNEFFERTAKVCEIKLFKTDDENLSNWIVNFSLQEDMDLFCEKTAEYILSMQKPVNVGVGISTKEIASLNMAYSQALFAYDFSKINENDAITFFSSITSLSGGYYYPLEKESSIKNYLKSGDYEKAEEVFAEVFTRNFERKPVSLERTRNFFSNVQNTCLKVIDEIGMDDNLLEVENISEINSLSICEEKTREIYKAICDFVVSNRHLSDDALKDEICKYTDDNYSKSDFSLSTIAEKMNMSPSYVSKLLKQYLGCNFLDYINHKRIDKAKELLISDDKIEVGEIAVIVGYDNDTTFRRIFKKYEGVTPIQFRQSNK